MRKAGSSRTDAHAGRRAQPQAIGEIAAPVDWMERLVRCSRLLLVARLAAPAAHEIINPVSAVVNLASLMQSMLKDDAFPMERGAELRTFMSQVVSEAARAGRIASELLAFATATSRVSVRTDLNEIVRRAHSLAAHLLKTEDVESRLVLADGLPWILCDTAEMKHALLHVLINAAEAVEGRDKRQVTISTRSSADGLALLIEVQDTGEGVMPEHELKIFDPFFTTRRRPENPGLGLTVARAIMAAHSGSITVRSRPGETTSVTLALPVTHEGKG